VSGQVTGRAMVRPVRLGMVFKPSLDVFRLGTAQATLLWGGLYQPFFDPSDISRLVQTAARLGVDVLWALDNESASQQAAELDGYCWRGRDDWSPLAPAKDYMSFRLLGPERLLDEVPHDAWVLPDWDAEDPLADLFSAWFGSYDASDQGIHLARDFAVRSTKVRIDPAASLPASMSSWVTPILATGAAVDYTGVSPGAGFVVVDPSDVTTLMALWNLRAYGGTVFPWPMNHEGRVLNAAKRWLEQLRESGSLDRWRSGDGRPLDPRIDVWLATDPRQPLDPTKPPNPINPPTPLTEFLSDAGVVPMTYPFGGVAELLVGWRDIHPFMTRFSNDFSQPVAPDGRTINLPVPRIGASGEERGRSRGDVMAITLQINNVTGVKPDRTFSVANVRLLASLLSPYDGTLLQFDRPTADGRVLSISSHDQTVSISAVPSIAMFNKLIEATGWDGSQPPGGVFVTRLIERLGGKGSTIANQPGARAGLVEVARSPHGRPSGAIVERIKQYQGSWPDSLASSQVRSDYPGTIFRYLLAREILRPSLPVTCPHCTATVAVRPEDLATHMRCEMCLEDFSLGLALGAKANGRNDWLYQLAGHVDQARLSEALPVMAALQVLTSSWSISPSTIPHVLGWKVRGPNVDCEVDIATILHDRGMPTVIVGEAKSHLTSIDANDLANLEKIQYHIRSRGIECFVLVAVMRGLREEEIDILRNFATRPPTTLPNQSAINPVLPIVLTEKDLSIHQFDEHPMRWSPSDGVVGLARESCRRNLGMTTLENAYDAKGFYSRPRWS
jgi:hypothetical protein